MGTVFRPPTRRGSIQGPASGLHCGSPKRNAAELDPEDPGAEYMGVCQNSDQETRNCSCPFGFPNQKGP